MWSSNSSMNPSNWSVKRTAIPRQRSNGTKTTKKSKWHPTVCRSAIRSCFFTSPKKILAITIVWHETKLAKLKAVMPRWNLLVSCSFFFVHNILLLFFCPKGKTLTRASFPHSFKKKNSWENERSKRIIVVARGCCLPFYYDYFRHKHHPWEDIETFIIMKHSRKIIFCVLNHSHQLFILQTGH